MKAITYQQYGSPDELHLQELPKPIPADDEILIKVYATTVTSADVRLRSSRAPLGFGLIMRLVFGFSKPKKTILGSELAGVIEAVGKDVDQFCVGDSVFAFSDYAMGAYAEYICMLQHACVAKKPASLRFDEAASLSFGGTTALHFLRKANVRQGETVLVNGASGSVGVATIQIARHFGLTVTAVCSANNEELVRKLGAEHFIDYEQIDFTQEGEQYDVIVDTVGTAPYSRSKSALAEGGRLLMVLGELPKMLLAPLQALLTSHKVVSGAAIGTAEDLRYLADLAESGEYKPVIDRRFAFSDITEAHRYVELGHKKGNVVINVVPEVE